MTDGGKAEALRQYADAGNPCDVTLHGGHASPELVFPSALVRLAKRFFFRRIAGSGGAAPVAAMTAAAEYARRSRRLCGFPAFDKTADYLVEHPSVFGRMTTTRGARSILEVAEAVSADCGVVSRLVQVGASLYRRFPASATAGALIGLALAVGDSFAQLAGEQMTIRRVLDPIPVVVAAVNLLVGSLCGALVGVVAQILSLRKRVSKGTFGLHTGYSKKAGPNQGYVTNWLCVELAKLAGRENDSTPLTFGMLWDAPEPSGDQYDPFAGTRSIDLEMVTTCVSLGRPIRLPMGLAGLDLYFDPYELERYFPDDLVSWMVKVSPKTMVIEGKRYCHLPEPRDLPVLFAVRMSSGIPFVLDAVPLYLSQGNGAEPYATVARVLFASGSLVSGFPDRSGAPLLPPHPSFEFSVDRTSRERDASQRYEPRDPELGHPEQGRGRVHPIENYLDFAAALWDSARNWPENTRRALAVSDELVAVIDAPVSDRRPFSAPPVAVSKSVAEQARAAADDLAEQALFPTYGARRRRRFHTVVRSLSHAVREFSEDYALGRTSDAEAFRDGSDPRVQTLLDAGTRLAAFSEPASRSREPIFPLSSVPEDDHPAPDERGEHDRW